MTLKVTVVGGGRVGYYLVRTLIERGYETKFIEKDKYVCEQLASEMDVPIICGDASKIEILEAADIQHSDAVVCVTGSDQTNLIVCQLAKRKFGVKKTVAKSNNPKNVEAMKALGIDNVININDSIAAIIEREVDTTHIKAIMQLGGGTTLFEVLLPEDFVSDGKTLTELRIPPTMNVVSISRGGKTIIPRGQSMLKSGDKLLVISESSLERNIENAFKIKD